MTTTDTTAVKLSIGVTDTTPHKPNDIFVRLPDGWIELPHYRYQPFGKLQYPTSTTHLDPHTIQHHIWASRPNRKGTHHNRRLRAKQRIDAYRPYWTYIVCWNPTQFSWWTAWTVLLASIGFVIQGTAFLYPDIANSNTLAIDFGILATTSACLYTVSGFSQVLEILQAPMRINFTATHCNEQSSCQHVDLNNNALNSKIDVNAYTQHQPQFVSRHKPLSDQERLKRQGELHSKNRGRQNPNAETLSETVNNSNSNTPTNHNNENNDNSDNDHANGNNADTDNDTSGDYANGMDVMYDHDIPLHRRIVLVFGQFRRLDYTIAFVQMFGNIFFNIVSIAVTGYWDSALSPEIQPTATFWSLNAMPDIVGSFLFTVSGYLQIVEATHRLTPLSYKYMYSDLTNLGWHIAWHNFMGGVGFLASAIVYLFPPFCGLCNQAVQNDIPLLIGSWFYTIGSALLWYEQCQAKWDQTVDKKIAAHKYQY